jgi:membrane fusion protein (multidrug efflux system)
MRGAIAVLVTLLVAGCGQQSGNSTAEAPPEVRIAQVGAATAVDPVTGTGTVAWRRETSLGFTSAGRIASMTVNEGDSVRPGQLLAALDSTTVASAVSSARAERDRAAAEYARSAKLLEQGWVTRPRVDSAKSALATAEANVRSTQFQSRNAAIVAPGPGVVLARLSEPGQVVAAGTPVLVFGEAKGGRVLRLPLSERDVARIAVGVPASVSLGAEGDVSGEVIEIAGRADPATGTFAVEIGLPADPRLRSGMIGSARIAARSGGAEVPLVPASAVFAPRAGEGFVYIVDPATKRAKLRKVMIAEAGDAGIRVTSGVARGEWVATSRIDRLTDGMAVAPIMPATRPTR